MIDFTQNTYPNKSSNLSFWIIPNSKQKYLDKLKILPNQKYMYIVHVITFWITLYCFVWYNLFLWCHFFTKHFMPRIAVTCINWSIRIVLCHWNSICGRLKSERKYFLSGKFRHLSGKNQGILKSRCVGTLILYLDGLVYSVG